MSAPLGLEYKNAVAPDVVAPPDEGVIEALVAVTGVKDDVGDVIVPGAFTKTLQTRKPKVCLGHDWNRPIGKTLDIKELMPGDPNLPKTTADGKPWPKEAGAVWAQFQANMAIDDGKNAFHSAKFYGPESTYSIGYKATNAKHRGGTRYINELDLFEYGPVLHPANRLATLQSVKSEPVDDIEYTDADADEEKSDEFEELTLQDYLATLVGVEEKVVRYVDDAAYWGYPKGTPIRPGMKPRGRHHSGKPIKNPIATTRGTTTAKPDVPEGAKPDVKPETPKPTESLEKIQKIGEELGMEVRANPWPPEYIVKEPKGTRGYDGRVISFSADTGRATTDNGIKIPDGRVEEYMRTWLQERDKKGGYSPSAEWVLSQMDKPAREAAAKEEGERKKREIIAGATDEQLTGQAQHEIEMLARLDENLKVGQTPEQQAKARAMTERNLELLNEELTKRGLPAVSPPEAAPAAHPSLEEFGSEGTGLSTKPTGGRSIEQILDSMPVDPKTQHVRYRIAHGADVLDDPSGSGVFAVGPEGGSKDWTITLGNGLSIPASAMVRAQSNESAVNVSTPKKVTAWLKAMGALRDADGNPPPYGTGTSEELLAWKDSEGRTLRDALTDVVVPAYLKSIGKKGEVSDKSTPAKWKNAPLVAANNLPTEMYNEFTSLGSNAKQAYILGRTEGDDHATALKRARDMIANARGEKPTGPSYAPVNTETATGNQVQPTPPGEISTDRLLMMSRVTGPAAIAAMELPELERHDAELTRRAAELGKPGQVSPAHQAVKDALTAKREQVERDANPEVAKIRDRLAEQTDDPAQARRSGIPSRGFLAFSLAKDRLGMEINPLDYASIRPELSPEQMRERAREHAREAYLAGGIEGKLTQVERALNEIDSWNVDFGRDQALIDNTRAWVNGSREGLAERPLADRITSVSMEDGRTLSPINAGKGERQALGLTSGDLTLRVYELERPSDVGRPWAYDIVNNATGETTEGQGLYGTPGSALIRAEGEFHGAERRAREAANTRTVSEREESRRPQVAQDRAVAAEAATPVTARAAQRQDTITPELLDQAAESEAASVGLSETPDGALEVDAEVADRQDRVEKLIKDADDGTLNLAEQSTENLTATRRDLVDELRLQTAVRRRSPAPRPAPTEAPKTRPGLAGAAEDHAEALRSGDTAAIERTRARLESSIRRSRTDSEIARSLADSVTSPDENDAEQLSDLAKRLRAESRERRNATIRKRRAVKRIERARLQSLLGAVDTELRGRGVQLEQVAPELLAPDAEDNGRPNLTDKQRTVMLTADPDGWVVGHGVTVNSLVNNNLADRGNYSEIPPGVRQRGSSWARLNENGLAELALLRNP